jgi:hypothetical protein
MVDGGTAHGVGLEAPGARRGLRPRAKTLARSGLAAMNRVRSPFTWDGRKQWFAEPPHMLVSMLLLPRDTQPPEPGMELDADLRYTTTRFDRVTQSLSQCPAEGLRGTHAAQRWTRGRLTALSGDGLGGDRAVKPSVPVIGPRLHDPLASVLPLRQSEDARVG